MKNISRRVFIKGLAVAGVAAAASTVLAGCNTNMIPGVGDGVEDDTNEDTTTGNSFTYKDGDKTLVVTSPAIEVVTRGVAADKVDVYIDLNAVNGLDQDVKVVSAKPASATDAKYVMVLTVNGWDESGKLTLTAGTNAGNIDNAAITGCTNMCLTAGQTVAKNNQIKDGQIRLIAINDTWTKIEVTCEVYKAYPNADKSKYAYASKADHKHTFTYTND